MNEDHLSLAHAGVVEQHLPCRHGDEHRCGPPNGKGCLLVLIFTDATAYSAYPSIKVVLVAPNLLGEICHSGPNLSTTPETSKPASTGVLPPWGNRRVRIPHSVLDAGSSRLRSKPYNPAMRSRASRASFCDSSPLVSVRGTLRDANPLPASSARFASKAVARNFRVNPSEAVDVTQCDQNLLFSILGFSLTYGLAMPMRSGVRYARTPMLPDRRRPGQSGPNMLESGCYPRIEASSR
jgi:hypothetical protein